MWARVFSVDSTSSSGGLARARRETIESYLSYMLRNIQVDESTPSGPIPHWACRCLGLAMQRRQCIREIGLMRIIREGIGWYDAQAFQGRHDGERGNPY